MKRALAALLALLFACLEFWASDKPGQAPGISAAPSEDLVRVYGELRSLQVGEQSAVTESVAWKRDAGTFTFREGRLTFAAPVKGRVLAAVFEGQGTFTLNPPTPIDQHQIARFAKSSKLEDNFREAVFFFTDQAWDELQQLVHVQSGRASASAGKVFALAERKYRENFKEWGEKPSEGKPPLPKMAARTRGGLTGPT